MAAAAFLRFCGTDDLLAAEGPEALAAAVDELVRNIQDATASHGVSFHETDIDVDGGKVMLVAGAPRAPGDDVDHLLAAVRLVVDRAGRLPVRVGVAQGRVFAGDLGPGATTDLLGQGRGGEPRCTARRPGAPGRSACPPSC